MFEQIQGRNFVGYRDEAIRTVIARAIAIERRCCSAPQCCNVSLLTSVTRCRPSVTRARAAAFAREA